MAKLNPAEARKRKKHILAFDNAWYVNTATSEIRYREPIFGKRNTKFLTCTGGQRGSGMART